MNAQPTRFDVVIVGGGLHGCSTAYHLLSRAPTLAVAVVERDPAYAQAASVRSHAGVRILFSQIENLAMSQYGHEFYGNFDRYCAIEGEEVRLEFWRRGYLFLANSSAEAALMESNFALQTANGCKVEWLGPANLAARFPMLNTDDVVCATLSPNDGWIDPYGALMGLKRKARKLGATFVEATVTALEAEGGLVRRVALADGRRLAADWVVNNAGAWAHEITAMLDFDIPVRPLPRPTFYFESAKEQPPMPLTIDGQPCSFRQEGRGFISGATDPGKAGTFDWQPDWNEFEAMLWPRLAHRSWAFEALKLRNVWPCHYALNTFDGNMLIGAWPGRPENFLMATGFSGHGLQHAPASGRAMAELILAGRFEALDLDRFHCRRVVERRPEPEAGVKA